MTHAIRTTSFVYQLTMDCRLRHRHRRVAGRIISFAVQLEVRHPDRDVWLPVVRFDTAHGFAHRDWFLPDGSCRKTPLPAGDYKQALNYAETDLKEHWQDYRTRFLEELEHGQ